LATSLVIVGHVLAPAGLAGDIYPYAPLNTLIVDPHLPDWLPEITLEGLRVGDSAATIRFYRKENGSSDYRVLETQGRFTLFGSRALGR